MCDPPKKQPGLSWPSAYDAESGRTEAVGPTKTVLYSADWFTKYLSSSDGLHSNAGTAVAGVTLRIAGPTVCSSSAAFEGFSCSLTASSGLAASKVNSAASGSLSTEDRRSGKGSSPSASFAFVLAAAQARASRSAAADCASESVISQAESQTGAQAILQRRLQKLPSQERQTGLECSSWAVTFDTALYFWDRE